MIAPARRRAPRAMNYRPTGMWPGMGAYNPPSEPAYENCDPHDYPCVQRNVAAQLAYTQGLFIAQADTERDNCNASANANSEPFRSQLLAECASRWPANLASPIPVQNLPESWTNEFLTPAQLSAVYLSGGPTAAKGGGQLVFSSPHGTSAIVGDTWLIKITGAAPGGQVTVQGGQNGAQDKTNMGTTDGAGSWQIAGIFTADQIGSWSENWTVNGIPAGSVAFTVSAGAPGTPAVPTTPAGQVIINSSGATVPAATTPPSVVSGLSLSSIPWWGWLAAGGVALFAMKGGR